MNFYVCGSKSNKYLCFLILDKLSKIDNSLMLLLNSFCNRTIYGVDGKIALTLPKVLKCEDAEGRTVSSFPRLSGINK